MTAERLPLCFASLSHRIQVTIPRPELLMSSSEEQAEHFGRLGGSDSVQVSSPLVFDKLHVSQV